MKIQFHDLNEDRPTKDGEYMLCYTKQFGENEETYHVTKMPFENGKFHSYVEEEHKDGVTVYWAKLPTAKELREDW